MIQKLILIVLFFTLAACTTTADIKSATNLLPKNVEVTLSPGDGRVGTYTSSWSSFRTSSYWIDGPSGLILIDTQFLPSEALAMVDWAEKVTGKKVVLAIILHPNPDKFNGTETFQKRGIKVITSDQVLREIPSVYQLRRSWFYDEFKPDFPEQAPHPESFGNKTTVFDVAGIRLKAMVLSQGASDAHVVVQFENHLFVGDLVTIGFHSWLELGYLKEWLKRLDEIESTEAEFIHTGRGGSGDMDSVKREREYLRTVIQIVESHHPKKGHSIPEKISQQILREIVARYPAYDYPRFIENGIDATWKNLSR